MASRDVAACTTEYGVQTANSKTILTVCSDLAEAERTLDMLGEGRLLRRTVRYSPWTRSLVKPVLMPGAPLPGCSACGPRPAGHPTSPRHRRARCGHAGR